MTERFLESFFFFFFFVGDDGSRGERQRLIGLLFLTLVFSIFEPRIFVLYGFGIGISNLLFKRVVG